MKSLLLMVTVLCTVAATDEVPYWVMSGILAVETQSYYDYSTGIEKIIYVNKKVGASGELSAYQITKDAWRQVRRKGESFASLQTDQRYAEDIAMRYLCWLYDNSAHGNWNLAVEYYNGGPNHRCRHYLQAVKRNNT